MELAGLGFDWPNASLIHKLENTLGYNPLRIAHYSAAVGARDHVAGGDQRKFSALMPGYRSPFANLLGLRYIATNIPIEKVDPGLLNNPLPLVATTKTVSSTRTPTCCRASWWCRWRSPPIRTRLSGPATGPRRISAAWPSSNRAPCPCRADPPAARRKS